MKKECIHARHKTYFRQKQSQLFYPKSSPEIGLNKQKTISRSCLFYAPLGDIPYVSMNIVHIIGKRKKVETITVLFLRWG
jgi:hypothetical protein